MRSYAVSLVAALGAAASACGPTSAPNEEPATEDAASALAAAVIDEITIEGLERHARAIVQHERPSGSPGENAAIDSIVASLRADGVPVEVHAFDTYASDPVSAAVRVPAEGLTLEAITMAYSASTDGLRGPLVDVGTLGDLPALEVGTGERLALRGDAAMDGREREGFPDLRGAIALVEGQPRNVPTAALELLGAAGVVFTNPEERLNDLIVTSTWGTPSLRSYDRLPRIPAVQVTRGDGERLRALASSGSVEVEIQATVATGRKTLRLAVARVEAQDANAPYVLLGGHIDAWYHGGTDEGASNAVMVELAKAFHRHRDGLRRGLVVAWWPGHSNARYAGSTWFADHYFEELRDRAVAYLNIDGVGQIDAMTISATATASMEPLARQVVREAVGEGEIRSSAPGRNSDQSFNGVGLPLLQLNHARSDDDGGYWWWHTPDDTYDKIDFDVLALDAGLYARAIARLTSAAVLPVDPVAEVDRLGALIERRSVESEGRFDLGEALERQQALLEQVRAIQAALPGHEGADVDRALLSLLRPIYRVTYDPVDPFHPDPGLTPGLLPGLAPVTILAEEDPSSDRRLFAETTLVRERNRLLEALSLALAEAESLRARLGA